VIREDAFEIPQDTQLLPSAQGSSAQGSSAQSIAERSGYRSGEVADASTSVLRDLIAKQAGGGSSSSAAATAPLPVTEANLMREQIDSENTVVSSDEATAEAPVPVAALEPEQEPVSVSHAWAVSAEHVAPPQRVRVRRGDPIKDAQLAKNVGFRFDDGRTKQVAMFPSSLETLLRQDLAEMTNEQFARDVSLPSLLAAFVAAQLGAAAEKSAFEALDENTRTALTAFRMLDRRTGAIEGRLADLDVRTEDMLEAVKTTMYMLQRYSEKSRFIENGVTYLVTERLSPSTVASSPIQQAQLIDGKYRQVRDRLAELTDREIRDEKIAKGRPLR